MSQFLTALQAWYKKPFDANGSVTTWLLFVGLVIVLALIWANVLSYIKPVATTAAEAL
jgi:hypothetical protein